MWYHKLNFWFTSRIFFYNCCFSFLSLAKADLYFTVLIFITGGFLVGALAQRTLHKAQEFVFLNLGVSNLQRYGFAYFLHIIFAFLVLFFIYIWMNYV